MPRSKRSASTELETNLVKEYKETRLDEYQRKKKIAYAIVGIVVVLAIGIITSMVLWFTLRDPPPPLPPGQITVSLSGNDSRHSVLELTSGNATKLTLKSATGGSDAVIFLGANSEPIQNYSACGEELDQCYRIKSKSQEYKLVLSHETYPKEPDFRCTTVEWTGSLEAEITDCIELGSAHWYGGGLLFEQRWPMKFGKPMTPFVSGDILQVKTDYGSVLEPYWISTDGFALAVDWNAKDQPLHTSWNDTGNGRLCISARYRDSPYVFAGETSLKLKYSVCVGKNIEHVHKAVLQHRKPWDRPTGIPSAAVLQKPIWSTWVSYKTRLNQNDLQNFITEISARNFSASNIEIDDGYQVKYGDFSFNSTKFPNATVPIALAKAKGFNTTIWMYPFVNYDSEAFVEAMDKRYLVWTVNGKTPAMTSWWQGKLAGLVDFTNPEASKWYFDRLQKFRRENMLESYKFDGAESNWTPLSRAFYNQTVNPDFYGKTYAEAAHNEIGTGLEVRIGLHTQQLPIFVRMLDKDSVLGYDNGLKTLIPTALTFGLLGYPFVLPDMIGGNAYRNVSEGGVGFGEALLEMQFPSDKLYLRWLAATIFMPSIQFSITPWFYEPTSSLDPVGASLKLLEKRANYTDLFVKLAENATITGYPIVRPLWFINGSDARSWEVDDQFLVGDDLMVAPVLDPKEDYRDVYIPHGVWYDEIRGKEVIGPTDRYPIKVEVYQVAVFHRIS